MEKDILLEGSQATWTMPRSEGSLGGSYIGTFIFKCFLNPLEQLQAGRDFREMLGSFGSQASDVEINLAFALTQLKHRVIKSPAFWNSAEGMQGNLGDLNIIALVHDAANRAEELFVKRVQEERNSLLDQSIKTAEELLKKE